MKIATVVGARPQFVKAAVVSRRLSEAGLDEVLIHTGQHYDAAMSEVFFAELEIPEPAHHLGIGSLGHGAQTGRMLEALERVLLDEAPDVVLVYGDTNSTLAGALAAAKLHLPIAHVEAGLRSFNRRMPEEINRVLTDHLATLLFAPTKTAVENLRAEGIAPEQVVLTGDVMYDAALHYGAKAASSSRVLERLGLSAKGYVLATVHRAENTDDPARLGAIFGGLAAVADEMPVVLPLHPRTRRRLAELDLDTEALTLTEPLGYLDMLRLEQEAALIATDSGGVQKEAYFYQVPCVTLRDETEWLELLESGWNQLAPPVSAAAVAASVRARLGSRGEAVQLYGAGDAAATIARALAERP